MIMTNQRYNQSENAQPTNIINESPIPPLNATTGTSPKLITNKIQKQPIMLIILIILTPIIQ